MTVARGFLVTDNQSELAEIATGLLALAVGVLAV
jgi:hypothetical protein